MRIIVGISGASGAIYGIRLLQVLRELGNIESHLVVSNAGRMNIALETDWRVKDVEALADVVYRIDDITAGIASGTFRTHGMVVAPCSVKTLSAIAHCFSDNLMSRAADVTLKEKRRLVLVPRETPLHAEHCKMLYRVARLGADIVPPMPAFYLKPQSIADIVDQTVARILDLFAIEHELSRRWQGVNGQAGRGESQGSST